MNAYSSAAAIPVVGYIIAPIAAAMAVAAGAMQVAAIKKQQQASQAQGYGEGGFTRRGRADEVAGVVHAGENLCKPNANELARFAEAPPSLSNGWRVRNWSLHPLPVL